MSEEFVVTGGPGSGKTTLLDELGARGYDRTEEAGRGIIRDQLRIGGSALPWADAHLFAEMMLSWELRSYAMAGSSTGPVFFDRGVPDVAGFLRVEGHRVPKHVDLAAREFRYRRRVFVTPPWPEIYGQDDERKQSFDRAVRTCEEMLDTYERYGYELVHLPRVGVAERVRFLLDAL